MGQRLGQHFLKGTWAARALVNGAAITSTDTVIEIGPGKGALTREILATGAHVVAVEKDEKLGAILQETFSKEIAVGNLTIVIGDIRDVTTQSLQLKSGDYIVAANIPYYITGEIIRTFLTAHPQPRTMALLIQKEVAQRIVSNRESILSISVKAYGHPTIVAKVSRTQFSPPPAVDSSILVIDDISRDFFDDIQEKQFFTVVRAAFSSKRKLLLNNLSEKLGIEKPALAEALAAAKIPLKARAEEVPLQNWKTFVPKIATKLH